MEKLTKCQSSNKLVYAKLVSTKCTPAIHTQQKWLKDCHLNDVDSINWWDAYQLASKYTKSALHEFLNSEKMKNSSPKKQSANSRPTVGRQSTDSRTTVDRQSANCWPTVGRLSLTAFYENLLPAVGRQSADCWPTVGRMSVSCGPSVG